MANICNKYFPPNFRDKTLDNLAFVCGSVPEKTNEILGYLFILLVPFTIPVMLKHN